ncbi:MAG: methyltransferase [Alphaproteobacteria bacterium]|nr:methyltransferase [Alphaproteobacteria bacterium]
MAETDETTEDALLGGRIRLRQPLHGYRAAIDPVLLAAAVPLRDGDLVADVGLGTGAAALCLAARMPGVRVVGLEIQPDLVRLARDNAAGNGLADRVRVVEGDIATPPPGMTAEHFDVVMTNPPFGAAGTRPPDPQRATAHAGNDPDLLGPWLRFCLLLLRPKGRLVLIHRADRLDELLAHLRAPPPLGRLGAIEIIPLWPREGEPARRVIVRGRKGLKSPLVLLPGLTLHEGTGYSERTTRILRGETEPGDPFVAAVATCRPK